ncbi:hypothetical protein BGX28_004155 [Mortierella sp. GBA30]|nr:hypothetical protein BGX28_004155 [Mortierella sp. GBA30]
MRFQTVFAVKNFLMESDWVHDTLDQSWDNAYNYEPELIYELQSEYKCQGFHSARDRSLELPLDSESYLPPCDQVLETSFAKRLDVLASRILCIRILQLVGVLLLSFMFRYLAVLDQEDSREDDFQGLVSSSKKIACGLMEKQTDHVYAHVPQSFADSDEKNESPPYVCEVVCVKSSATLGVEGN